MTTTTHRKTTYNGAPMLDSLPFIHWLDTFGHWPALEIAQRVGVDEAQVRRWKTGERVSERHVERAGIALTGDPRLAAQLYPELDF